MGSADIVDILLTLDRRSVSTYLKDWNEHLHPRDDHGRFSETEGGGTGGTSFAGTGGKNGARVDDRIQQMADDNDIEIRYGKPSDPSDIQGDASGFHVTLTVGEGYSQEWLDAMALHELGHQWQAWNDADGPEHSDLEYETHAWDVAEQLAADLGIPWTAEKEAARQYGISSYARLETLRGDKDYRHPGAKDFNPALHPRDDHGQFSEVAGVPAGDDTAQWLFGGCGSYAVAVREMFPSTSLGYVRDDDGAIVHVFAHDDEFVYDAQGKQTRAEFEKRSFGAIQWDVPDQDFIDRNQSGDIEWEPITDEDIDAAKDHWQRHYGDGQGSKDFNPALHPRDDQGQFAETAGGWTRDPVERLTALKGAWKDWQRAGITEMSSAQIAAHGDPRLEVTGYAGSILGGDPVAARWQGDHIQITAEGWDRSEPDMRAFLLAHETSHAAAADILANNANKDELLHPFRNTPNGQTFSENALAFPGESDSFARGPEEMMADVGANLLTFGRNVLWDRFESEKEFDISPTPPDPRLVRLYDTVAESLDRVGNPPPDHAPEKAYFDPRLHPRYPAGSPGGLGGQFIPTDPVAFEGAGASMRDRAERMDLHVGDPVHFISRNDGRYYHGTVTKIDALGVHVDVPKQYSDHNQGNADSVKEPEHIRPEYLPIEIPPEAPYHEMSNGSVIVGPWDPQFPDRAQYATLIIEQPPMPPRVRALTAAEARVAIREDKATAGDFHEGDLVVTSDGDVGTLMRTGGPRGDGTASIRLSDGRVLADIMPKQHAGTWSTPTGWVAAGVTANGRAREVYQRTETEHAVYASSTDDGSGRTYAIEYPSEWRDGVDGILGLRDAVEYSVGQNHAMEEDSGLKNRWNGTIRFDTMSRGVAAYKDWRCSISIGDGVLRDLRGRDGYPPNPKDIEDGQGVLSHELAHGLSTDLSTDGYQGHTIPLEEGVAEAYREAFMAVRAYGPDRLTPSSGPVTDSYVAVPPGYMSYSAYVNGVNTALRLKNEPHYPDRAHRGKETWGDRLDWARDLLQTPLTERQAKINAATAESGQHVEFVGTGIGSEMGYRVENNETKARGNPQTADDVRAIIMSSLASVEDAERALGVVREWIADHPEDATTVGMDAECLYMLITAQESTQKSKEFTEHLHPRDDHGRFAEVPGTTPENYRETWKPAMTPEEGHAWAKAAGTKYEATVVHMTGAEHIDGIEGEGFHMAEQTIHEEGIYFATDVPSASFYDYKGNTALSAVVVLKNPVVLDWTDPAGMEEGSLARSGDFRGAALEAAGVTPEELTAKYPQFEEQYTADSFGSAFAYDPEEARYAAWNEVRSDAVMTTDALREAGYDGVVIRADSAAESDVERDAFLGGSQLIVFDKEQAVVIGTEHVPNWRNDREAMIAHAEEYQRIIDEQGEQAAARWLLENPSATEGAVRRAFAKEFTEHLHPRDDHGRFAEVPGTTPENYRETWKPAMTPEEGHAWAKAAGTKIPQTVVHMTHKESADGIKGTGFNASAQSIHEYGRYFAVDPDTAEFYEYKGSTAVSTVVVAQNPLALDWRGNDLGEMARTGNFRGAALEAAGFDPQTSIGEHDTELRANGFVPEEHEHDLRWGGGDLVWNNAEATTALLKSAGYDSVSIFAHSGGNEDPTTGGDQLIVFDREQAVAIGTEQVPSMMDDRNIWRTFYSEEDQALLPNQPEQTAPREEWERYWDLVEAWTSTHPNPGAEALARAFAKGFEPSLHPRDDHGRFVDVPGGSVGEMPPIREFNPEVPYASFAGAGGLQTIFDDLAGNPEGPQDYGGVHDAASELKAANVVEIGTALFVRAQDDPELRAQLQSAGTSILNVYSGFGVSDDLEHLSGGPNDYQWERLHIEAGSEMTIAEAGARQVAAAMQDAWMGSSSDSSMLSWGMQVAVAERMGVTPDLSNLTIWNSGQEKQIGLALDQMAPPDPTQYGPTASAAVSSAMEVAHSPAVVAYVDEVYSRTQAFLHENGITEVAAYRGVEETETYRLPPRDSVERMTVELNPLSSWSISASEATPFQRAGGAVLAAAIPAERVFSLPMTGPGCFGEMELIVVGGGDATVRAW